MCDYMKSLTSMLRPGSHYCMGTVACSFEWIPLPAFDATKPGSHYCGSASHVCMAAVPALLAGKKFLRHF